MGHAKLALHFGPAFAGGGDVDARQFHWPLEDRIVDQEVDLVAGLVDHHAADPAVVAVLVDEPLAVLVDEDSLDEGLGRVPRAGRKELVHVDGVAADAHAHADARAVVHRADGVFQAHRLGRIAAQHVRVHRKAAGAEDHASGGADEAFLAVQAHDKAIDATVLVAHQTEHAGRAVDLRAKRAGAGFQDVDQLSPAAPALPLDDVAARRGPRLFGKGPRLFAAAPDQRVVALRFDDLARKECALVGNALVLQPLEVGQAIVGIEADLGCIRIRSAGHHQIGSERLGRIVEAGRALDRRAAAPAKIDFPAGQG